MGNRSLPRKKKSGKHLDVNFGLLSPELAKALQQDREKRSVQKKGRSKMSKKVKYVSIAIDTESGDSYHEMFQYETVEDAVAKVQAKVCETPEYWSFISVRTTVGKDADQIEDALSALSSLIEG